MSGAGPPGTLAGRRFVSETLWASRPLPSVEHPDRDVWRGAPATLAELRALRMKLRAGLSHGGRPAAATDDDVDRLLLAFEELVSNALRHGRGPVQAAVTTSATGWLLEVSDAAGENGPVPAVGRDAALGGLGLYLVAQLCGSHGWSAQGEGRKVVWARLDFTGDGDGDGDGAEAAADAGAPTALRPGTGAPASIAPTGFSTPRRRRDARRRTTAQRAVPRPFSILVTAIVLALVLVLAWLAATANAHSNQRLLQQQVDQAAALLRTQLAVLQTQMTDAGQVADATVGRTDPFLRFASETVQVPGKSLSLWHVTGARADLIAVRGSQPVVPAPGGAAGFFSSLKPDGQVHIAGIVEGPRPSLAYGLMPAGETHGLVVYAEIPLTRRVSVPTNGPFSGVDLAVYLGPVEAADQLVQATVPIPIRGDTATTRVPFGNTSFTIIAASRSGLTGALSADLPWIVLGAGAVMAILSGATVEMLSRRRLVAERLAAVNQRLYQEQRSIAGTLQHALLPEVPQLANMQAGARYVAGADDLEVGGDWYDVIPGPAGRCVFVVGDISGQGLSAATTMAELRFALRAYLAQGDDLATVLTKLRGLLDIGTDHQFATVLLGEVDPQAGRIRVVSAGHFWPLVICGGRTEFLSGRVAPPVGVPSSEAPVVVEARVTGPATLLAFTDGAMERRGEDLDTGLERLRTTAERVGAQPLPEVLDGLMQMATAGGRDDTVILALRWTS